MRQVLLDTSRLVALLDSTENNHKQCVEAVSALDATMVTCEGVILESCYLLRGIPGAPLDVLHNVKQGIFQIPFRLTAHISSIATLMRKYADVPMDFADACLVELANQCRTGRILTLDSDFEIYRWGRNRPFELLLTPTR
jgi:predicted nucleic acid-binding protein